MACDDDLDLVHKEESNRNDARDARDNAFDDLRKADTALGTARAGRADCGSDHPLGEMIGFCSDEQQALDAAENRYDNAKGDLNTANDALAEAEGWLDAAEEGYCDCLREQADTHDDNQGDTQLDDDPPIA